MVQLSLKNVSTGSTSQAQELSIKITWAKYCEQIGLLMQTSFGGKSGGNFSRLPLQSLSEFSGVGKLSNKCALFLFLFFLNKIIKPLFYPFQLLSFTYAGKQIHACTECNLYPLKPKRERNLNITREEENRLKDLFNFSCIVKYM